MHQNFHDGQVTSGTLGGFLRPVSSLYFHREVVAIVTHQCVSMDALQEANRFLLDLGNTYSLPGLPPSSCVPCFYFLFQLYLCCMYCSLVTKLLAMFSYFSALCTRVLCLNLFPHLAPTFCLSLQTFVFPLSRSVLVSFPLSRCTMLHYFPLISLPLFVFLCSNQGYFAPDTT